MSEKKHRETARHREAFEVWYQADRDCKTVANRFHVSLTAVYQWRERFHWDDRADVRDREVERRLNREAVKRRAEMIERHRRAAQLLLARGTQYLTKNEMRHERNAIEAIRTGAELERLIEGLPTWVIDIATADDATVVEMARKAAEQLGLLDSMAGGGAPAGPANHDSR